MFTHAWGSLSSSSSSTLCFQQNSRKKSSIPNLLRSARTLPRTTTPCSGGLLTLPFEPHMVGVVGRATLDEMEDPILVQQQEEGTDAGDQNLPTQKKSVDRRRSLRENDSAFDWDSTDLLLQRKLVKVIRVFKRMLPHSGVLVKEIVQSIKVLKDAAKTRKVKAEEVLSALSVIEKSKLDPSRFLETLGGSQSPGRTWMLIFTAENKFNQGRYFPITAIQRFDDAGKRIENGVFLGPLGYLTFEGRFSWKKRILAFVFERIRIKVGPFNPFEIGLGQQGGREPNNKDPFFIWFYIDEEIAVARGKSGGTAFWCRCRHVASY